MIRRPILPFAALRELGMQEAPRAHDAGDVGLDQVALVVVGEGVVDARRLLVQHRLLTLHRPAVEGGDHRREVVVRASCGGRRSVCVAHGPHPGQRQLVRPRQVEHEIEVLDQQRGREQRRELALEELWGLVADERRGEHRTGQCPAHGLMRQPRALGKQERLRHQLGLAGDEQVHDELERAGRAGLARMHDVAAEMREHAAGALDVGRRPPDEDRERPLFRRGHAAEYGRIHVGSTASGALRRGRARRGRSDRGTIDHERAPPQRLEHAVRCGEHLLERRRIGEHGEHHLGVVHGIARCPRAASALRHEIVPAAGAAVPDGERRAGGEESRRHGVAHAAQAEHGHAGQWGRGGHVGYRR
jgi:hypothetical protein